jgi:hypothetical protein
MKNEQLLVPTAEVQRIISMQQESLLSQKQMCEGAGNKAAAEKPELHKSFSGSKHRNIIL